jgi:hypothetical protein
MAPVGQTRSGLILMSFPINSGTPNMLRDIHRHLPRRPTFKGDEVGRHEFTRLMALVHAIQREQDIQMKRIAQVQQELDELKALIKRLESPKRR